MEQNKSKTRRSLPLLDYFGEQVSFNIQGRGDHKSFLGMLFSLAILATVGSFGVKKFLVMKDYEDTKH